MKKDSQESITNMNTAVGLYNLDIVLRESEDSPRRVVHNEKALKIKMLDLSGQKSVGVQAAPDSPPSSPRVLTSNRLSAIQDYPLSSVT